MSNRAFYKDRFLSFKKGICPYCDGKATLEPNNKGYRGHCEVCNAENNFTNPLCKVWMEE
jgi:predicted amidophosphoribosyltransferase